MGESNCCCVPGAPITGACRARWASPTLVWGFVPRQPWRVSFYIDHQPVDASPVVSPRSAPRWGKDLPPVLELDTTPAAQASSAAASAGDSGGGSSTCASGGGGGGGSTEAADALAASAVWQQAPNAALVAMEPGARLDAVSSPWLSIVRGRDATRHDLISYERATRSGGRRSPSS